MIRAMAGDGIFIAALFFELLAALSILERSQAIALPEAFAPVMSFYRLQALPILAPLAHALRDALPKWLPDAALIASVFFFHFFIAQARRAVAPFESEGLGAKKDRAEAVIDWALPGAACVAGAVITGPTLLPLLTLPVALVLTARRVAGHRSWFEVPPAYFANLLGLALVPVIIAALRL